MASLMVRLEGLYVTRGAAFPAAAALIERAALNQLFVDGCTLDPGGAVALDNTRAPLRESMRLDQDYGFVLPAELLAFDQRPEIVLARSLCGPLAIDLPYRVDASDSVIDAGSGPDDNAPALALSAASGNPELAWGPPLQVAGVTCLGRMRVHSVSGRGGIWLHALQAHDNQAGCVKFSRFAASGNRLPPHHGCVFGHPGDLHLVAHTFGKPGYAQLAQSSDSAILEQGPDNDEMGAFGFLRNSHKWKNIHIRYREYMPVGIRPVLITVT
jgi:hypothetical protein